MEVHRGAIQEKEGEETVSLLKDLGKIPHRLVIMDGEQEDRLSHRSLPSFLPGRPP